MGNTLSSDVENANKEREDKESLEIEIEKARKEREESWKKHRAALRAFTEKRLLLEEHLKKHPNLKNDIYQIKTELEILKELLKKDEQNGNTRLNIIEHEKLLQKKIEAFDEQKRLTDEYKTAKNFKWDRECDLDYVGSIYSNLKEKLERF